MSRQLLESFVFHQTKEQICTRHTRTKACEDKRYQICRKKQFHKGIDEFTITRSANISPSTVRLQFNETFANRLCTVEEAFRRNVFKVVDLKVKVIQKQEGKQLVYKNGVIHI